MLLPCRALVAVLLSPLAWALPAAVAWAEHCKINLTVIAPEGEAEAHADQEPPVGGVNPRPKLVVKVDDPLVLQFFLTNDYPHDVLTDVTVRYVVVRTLKIGQKELPDLHKGVVTQGSAVMNFKPQCRVGARLEFRIDAPGTYLVRVETLNTNGDHEHFSAIDLEAR